MRRIALLFAALSAFSAACATKTYVRDQVQTADTKFTRQFEEQDTRLEEQDTRLRETAERVEASREAIDATDQRLRDADQRLGDVDVRMGKLDAAASEAQTRADQASQDARDAEARLSQRIADRNKYRPVETRFIYFDADRADIRDAGVNDLADVAKALKADPNAIVELQGFADPRGSDRYNDELARQRVEAVTRHLVNQHGIELRQIRAVAMGKVPLAAGQKPSSERLALARRVEVRLVAPWSSWEDIQTGTLTDDRAAPSAMPALPLNP